MHQMVTRGKYGIGAAVATAAALMAAIAVADETPGASADRYTVPEGFAVEQVTPHEDTGSLVALTFNAAGEIIASVERGPLLLVRDADADGRYESVDTFCDEMRFCQGILVLDDSVLAVGNGPDDTGLYRLRDEDGDRHVDVVEQLFGFTAGMQDHGPHVPILGPDGYIYLLMGNFAAPTVPYAPTSPHYGYYEGDLLHPRYEDAAGHAAGKLAPGGKVVRTDADGSFVELICAGFRNPYDIAFNAQGDLFTYDADMEFDDGMPWYRPTRINHVVPGGEFGWRSGWAKWPTYYLDSLPPVHEIGRGSPTGIVFYHHDRYPAKYHDALFIADWARGRILSVRLQRDGATYAGESEVLIEGTPLNVTDLEVGPDGCLYFCTGGRNTEGGIYRLVHEGHVPTVPPAEGIMRAVRQSQPESAWARARIAAVKDEMAERWPVDLKSLARDRGAAAADRVAALDRLQVFGPRPELPLLIALSHDEAIEVRAKTTDLLGLCPGAETATRLSELLDDPEPAIRRRACESLVRAAGAAPIEKLLDLLRDTDRFVAWAARRALERQPLDDWRTQALEHPDERVFLHGATAVLIVSPDATNVEAILARCRDEINRDPQREKLVDYLRVIELALHLGQRDPTSQTDLRDVLDPLYPAGDWQANRELVRLLVAMEANDLPRRFVGQLHSDVPMLEKLHVATHAPFVTTPWSTDERDALLEFYEAAHETVQGRTADGYVEAPMRDFLAKLPDAERIALLAECSQRPLVAARLIELLPEQFDAQGTEMIIAWDRGLRWPVDEATRDAAQAALKRLAASDLAEAHGYLRDLFEERPERRGQVAAALAERVLDGSPAGDDWPLLIRSLSVVEGEDARQVLRALARFDGHADDPAVLRQVILLGLSLGRRGERQADHLLERWTGRRSDDEGEPTEAGPAAVMASWQTWFRNEYPDQPDPSLPVAIEGARWSFDDLVGRLGAGPADHGDADRGASVFEKAECAKCHRFGTRGEAVGPDLSTVNRRFQVKEIIASIIYPSQVISDQFASKTVVTTDGRTLVGMMGPAGDDAYTLLTSKAEKLRIARDEIDEILPNNVSSMPEGLLDRLSFEEIADLIAYLTTQPVEAASSGN